LDGKYCISNLFNTLFNICNDSIKYYKKDVEDEMNILAWYLPQFHETKENNEWWGKGFTEWTNVKKAKRLYSDQQQPRVPLNNNYYDLSDINTIKWQISLAKRFGIYGFCMYHYWFDGKLLLEKPVEMYLHNKELDFPFCLCWTNERWTNSWKSDDAKILIDQYYGDETNWEKHFQYFLAFFKDERYIRVNGKPFLGIYVPQDIDCLKEMTSYWQKRAVECGLPGISLFYQGIEWNDDKKKDDSMFDYEVLMEPALGMKEIRKKKNKSVYKLKEILLTPFIRRLFRNPLFYLNNKIMGKWNEKSPSYSYEEVWQNTINRMPYSPKTIPAAFSDWDNTCRKQERGTYLSGSNPEIFKKYFRQLVLRARTVYKKDMMFFFAWNEWAESGYLEPDTQNGYGYGDAIHEVLEELNELPD